MLILLISNTNGMKGSKLSFEYLKVFRDLVKTRNFRQAAALNFITQSAISQQLAYLERSFGKKLIEREKGQFILTPEGVMVLESANTILETEQRLRESLQQRPNQINGTLKIESAYSVGLHLLPPLIRKFMKKHAQITLDLGYFHSDHILSDLAAGACDFGILVLPAIESEKFDIHPFLREQLVYVCSPYHRHAHKKSISVKQMKNEPFVAFNKHLQTRQLIDQFFRNNGVAVDIIHEGENIETLKRVVEVGGGVSILPKAAVAQEIKSKTLKSLTIEEGPLYRDAVIATKRGKSLSRAGHVFLNWILRQGKK